MPAAQASQTRTEFLLVADPALGLESNQIPLEIGRWTIGSGKDNRVVATGSGIDEQHCLILVRSGQLLMKSWGQRTLVNREESREAFLIAGDVLTLGEADFQIRHGHQTESDEQTESIASRIETLSGIVEELDKELSGRQANVDRLDATIARIQANLDDRVGSESTVARLRSQVDSLQESVTNVLESDTADTPAEACASDLRVETAQQNLDQILNEFEESEQSSEATSCELQLSMRVEQQLRQLESVSASLENRAAVLEQQALELHGQQALVSHRPSDEHRAPEASSTFEGHQANTDHATAADEVTAHESVAQSSGHDFSSPDEASGTTAHDSAPSEDALNSYVNEQRQKLQTLMDDFESFQDSQNSSEHDEEVTVSESVLEEIRTTLAREKSLENEIQDAEEHSEAEIREAVTAAVIDGSSQLGEVTAARRSRDEAIRQLDDLIRFAADESLSDVPAPALPKPPVGPEGCSTISNFDAVSGADTVVEGETAWATPTGLEIDFDEESANDESEQTEVSQSDNPGDSFDTPSAEDSIEATFDFATEQLAAFSDEDDQEPAPYDRTLTELEFETGATSTLVESGLTAEDAVPEDSVTDGFAVDDDVVAEAPEQESEFPSGFSWATATPDETTADQTSEEETPDETDIEDTWREEDGEFSPSDALATLEETSASEVESADESEPAADSSDSPENRVQELRAQLAQMFDLPEDASADSEASPISAAAPQESLWETTVVSESDADDDDPPAPGVPHLEAAQETASRVSSDASTQEETQSEANDESTEPDSAESHETASSEEEADADDPNSIDAYMQQLLARNRQMTGAPATPEPVSRPEPAKETSSNTEAESPKNEDKKDGQNWLTEGPKHRQDREAVRASLTTLREVANQSARSAVAHAGRTQLRREILTLTAASLICLVFAIAAALLKVNPLLPLGAVGVSLFFAVKLGIEIRRSAALLRQTKATSSTEKNEKAKSESTISPDEVILDTETE